MKKALFKIACFVLTGIILLSAFSYIFRGGRWFEKGYIYDRTARRAAFEAEAPGQFDVINLGDSLSICALSPPELFRDFGFAAYNLGQDMQYPVESYYALKRALKTQPVKVALLETNGLFYMNTLEKECEQSLSESLMSAFQFLRYHNLWKIPFRNRSIRTYFKGYTINRVEKPFTFEEDYDFSNTTVFYPMYPQQFFWLKKIQRLCEKNDVKLILYSSSSIMNYYTMRKRNTLLKLCGENNIAFIDANYDKDIVGIDWDTDTWDNGDHLNLSGCRKMTAYLGKQLRDGGYGLPDHRDDPVYDPWKDMYEEYLAEIEKMDGKNYAIIEKELGFPKQ